MPFSFTVDRPKNLKATLENVKKLIDKSPEVTLDGDEHRGNITSDGIKGTYVVRENAVEITVNEKPWHYADILIKNRIKKVFNECSE